MSSVDSAGGVPLTHGAGGSPVPALGATLSVAQLALVWLLGFPCLSLCLCSFVFLGMSLQSHNLTVCKLCPHLGSLLEVLCGKRSLNSSVTVVS